ncbi:MAG: hypothetical protein ACOC9Z_05150 [Chloroflexota bacterium]
MFEQDRFIVRLQQRVMREDAILVCFLGGSFGERREDDYSDLDVVLVYGSEEARSAAWAQRRDFARSVLPYVPAKSFDAAHVRPHFHVALYGNGAKVDYLFTTTEELEPNPWHREIRILKDSGGWGEAHENASARALAPQVRMEAAEMERIDDRFWAMFWDVYRQLLRGDREKPFPVYLELLYFTLPPLLRALPPEDPAYQGLLRARYSQDTSVTLEHLRQLIDAYVAARSAIIRRQNVGFMPDGSFERTLRQTMERRT